MILFRKEYDGEMLYDLSRDVMESLDPDFNEMAEKIPVDEHGFQKGTFRVTIEWIAE